MSICSICTKPAGNFTPCDPEIHIQRVWKSLDSAVSFTACKHIFHLSCLFVFPQFPQDKETIFSCPFEDPKVIFSWKHPETGYTLLHYAIQNHDVRLFKQVLVFADHQIGMADQSGITPFQLAMNKVELQRLNHFGLVNKDLAFIADCLGHEKPVGIPQARSRSHTSIIKSKLKQIPLVDQILLKMFFNTCILKHQAAHVILFSTKPVCLATFKKKNEQTFEDVLGFKTLQIFRKYKSEFSYPNFIFSEYQDEEEVWLFLINKNSIKTFMEMHLDIFQQKLGPGFTIDFFLFNLERQPLLSLIKQDEILCNMLLGFGKESSITYQEQCQLLGSESVPASATFRPIDITVPAGCPIQPMNFLANPQSEETQSLRSIYQQELRTFWAQYTQQENHLQWILETICK